MIRLGRARISPAFIIMLAAFVLLDGTALLLGLMASVALHELAHVAAILRRGGSIERVELRAFRINIRLGRETCLSYRDEMAVALAGPLANIAAAAALTLWSAVLGAFAGALFMVAANAALCLFNLLPIEDLDGGRTLRALLMTRMDMHLAERICTAVSWAFMLPLLALSVMLVVWSGYNLSLAFIAVHMLVSMAVKQARAG